jgi:photosystem II stability/assembly factor-like uncharacterized protein
MMIKKLTYPLLFSLLLLALTACATAGAAEPTTSASPTAIPSSVPTRTTQPSSTPPPPTETSIPLPPTATPTAPENVIQHFPSGQQFTVTYIHMIDANMGWAIGGLTNSPGDHILVTKDAGNTWKDVTPPQLVAANDTQQSAIGFFQDSNNAWVIYSFTADHPVPAQAVIWHTSDGGASWMPSEPLDISGLNELFVPSNLQFVTGTVGWMLVHVGVGMNHDYVVLYRTNDGGQIWSSIIDPTTDGGIQSCTKTAMLFTDATHGWLTGDCHGVKAGVLLFKSTDAGSTWQTISLPDPSGEAGLFTSENVACGAYDPFFFGNDLGHLNVTCANFTSQQTITNSYYIFTTQNGGSSWSGHSYPGTALYFISADTGWALSAKIQLTTDGGNTWKVISNVTWTPQMDFISETLGWAVVSSGNQEALVKSDNGGATWTELTPVAGQ